jgi:hypothetical protein
MTTLQHVNILARGYFPKELPPAFDTSAFATAASSLTVSPDALGTTSPVTLNLARPGTLPLRRRLGILNPFSQLELAVACERKLA